MANDTPHLNFEQERLNATSQTRNGGPRGRDVTCDRCAGEFYALAILIPDALAKAMEQGNPKRPDDR
jgi:hypothetical protein